MPHHPQPATAPGHVEPVPRRIRGTLAGRTVLDTTRALYRWDWPFYPQFQVPIADVDAAVLVDEDRRDDDDLGTVARHGLRVGDVRRPGAVREVVASADRRLVGTARVDWDALDAWFEEEEQVFVHPRSPYVRVDALRSSRTVRVELGGVVLAESSSPVLVFETGLPTRYYLDRSAVDLARLRRSDTVSACPYKGRTSAWWSVETADGLHADLAWSYDFPTRQLLPVAGLIAFLDERLDVTVDGEPQERPRTHFA